MPLESIGVICPVAVEGVYFFAMLISCYFEYSCPVPGLLVLKSV